MKLVTLASLASVASLAGVLAGCGSNPTSPADDGGSGGGGGSDLAVITDSSVAPVDQAGGGPTDLTVYNPPSDAGAFTCGNDNCNLQTQVCCVTLPNDTGVGGGGACATKGQCTNGLPVSCGGPENCGGKPCCLTLVSKTPKDISCVAAQTDCVPNLDLTASGKTRLCHVDADCTAGASGTMYPDCCSGMQGGVEQHFCFNKGFAGVFNFKCP